MTEDNVRLLCMLQVTEEPWAVGLLGSLGEPGEDDVEVVPRLVARGVALRSARRPVVPVL